MKKLSLFRLSGALMIVLIASSFTINKGIGSAVPAKVTFLPPGTETQTIAIPYTILTATAKLVSPVSSMPPYQITVSINGTSLLNLPVSQVAHSGGTIILDTFRKHVTDPATGDEYDIEVKISGYGTTWRIQDFTVFKVLV